MSTASMADLYTLIRTRLLGFTPLVGDGLDTLLGNRLYIAQAPDDAAFPYATMRCINVNRDGAYQGYRMSLDVEVLFYAQPRSQQQAVEGYADVADQALLGWHDATDGLAFNWEGSRLSLPVYTAPGDREVAGVRCVYPVKVWPSFLTQYANHPES
jgi:hypothetical protein